MAGIFITFEGIEGCGKTTQIKLLDDELREMGFPTVLTREPGGTPISERIRAILLDPASSKISPKTELLLYAAGRNQHIYEVISPAISSEKIVLCDRYADATTAYQGAARDIAPEIIESVHRIATDGLMPDLTILLDCDVEVGLSRAIKRNSEESISGSGDRFEREKIEFHQRVREGYLKISSLEPARVKVFDATEEPSVIHSKILSEVKRKIGNIE